MDEPRRRLLDLAREWWWTLLPAVVALSIGVSSLSAPPRPPTERVGRRGAVSAPAATETASPLHGVPHRLIIGHTEPRPFDYPECLDAHARLTKRQAQRFCLAKAHLHTTTPFST